jgi:hypothetical protein
MAHVDMTWTIAAIGNDWLPDMIQAICQLVCGPPLVHGSGKWREIQLMVKQAADPMLTRIEQLHGQAWRGSTQQRKLWARLWLDLSIQCEVNPVTWPSWCAFVDWLVIQGVVNKAGAPTAVEIVFWGKDMAGQQMRHSARHVLANQSCAGPVTYYLLAFDGHVEAVDWQRPWRPAGSKAAQHSTLVAKMEEGHTRIPYAALAPILLLGLGRCPLKAVAKWASVPIHKANVVYGALLYRFQLQAQEGRYDPLMAQVMSEFIRMMAPEDVQPEEMVTALEQHEWVMRHSTGAGIMDRLREQCARHGAQSVARGPGQWTATQMYDLLQHLWSTTHMPVTDVSMVIQMMHMLAMDEQATVPGATVVCKELYNGTTCQITVRPDDDWKATVIEECEWVLEEHGNHW